jgi:hypothetical protein
MLRLRGFQSRIRSLLLQRTHLLQEMNLVKPVIPKQQKSFFDKVKSFFRLSVETVKLE